MCIIMSLSTRVKMIERWGTLSSQLLSSADAIFNEDPQAPALWGDSWNRVCVCVMRWTHSSSNSAWPVETQSRLAWGLAAWAGESPLKGLQLGSSVGTAMWLAHKRQDQRASWPTFICFPTPDKRQRQGARIENGAYISSLARSLSVPSSLSSPFA